MEVVQQKNSEIALQGTFTLHMIHFFNVGFSTVVLLTSWTSNSLL